MDEIFPPFDFEPEGSGEYQVGAAPCQGRPLTRLACNLARLPMTLWLLVRLAGYLGGLAVENSFGLRRSRPSARPAAIRAAFHRPKKVA